MSSLFKQTRGEPNMTDSILLNNTYCDENNLTDEETQQAAGMIVFLVDVYILEKRGENFKDLRTWQRLFTLAHFGAIAEFLDYDNPEVKQSFKEMFDTLPNVIPVKIENKDGVNILVTIDEEHELYNSFFTNEAFLTVAKKAEEKFSKFLEEQDDKPEIILQ